jgi:LPS-assembly lipoprotein
LGCAGLVGGCFQPLYGTSTLDNYGAPPPIRTALASVEVAEIDAPNGTPEARLGVDVRNALIFGLTGGSGQLPPAYMLKINLKGNRQHVIVDTTTARPDMEIYGIDATYSLTEIATKKTVLTGRAFSRQSYDIPGQQQRFARQRGERDAQNRASTIIADQIKSRLASYFVSGG